MNTSKFIPISVYVTYGILGLNTSSTLTASSLFFLFISAVIFIKSWKPSSVNFIFSSISGKTSYINLYLFKSFSSYKETQSIFLTFSTSTSSSTSVKILKTFIFKENVFFLICFNTLFVLRRSKSSCSSLWIWFDTILTTL